MPFQSRTKRAQSPARAEAQRRSARSALDGARARLKSKFLAIAPKACGASRRSRRSGAEIPRPSFFSECLSGQFGAEFLLVREAAIVSRGPCQPKNVQQPGKDPFFVVRKDESPRRQRLLDLVLELERVSAVVLCVLSRQHPRKSPELRW
jgi:hypothetical protein